MRTFAFAAALLATTVTAFPIPNRRPPCGSKGASKTVSLDLPTASNTLEHQQYFESPRLGKPLQVAVTIEVPHDGDALSKAENEKSPGMLSPVVYLLSPVVYLLCPLCTCCVHCVLTVSSCVLAVSRRILAVSRHVLAVDRFVLTRLVLLGAAA